MAGILRPRTDIEQTTVASGEQGGHAIAFAHRREGIFQYTRDVIFTSLDLTEARTFEEERRSSLPRSQQGVRTAGPRGGRANTHNSHRDSGAASFSTENAESLANEQSVYTVRPRSSIQPIWLALTDEKTLHEALHDSTEVLVIERSWLARGSQSTSTRAFGTLNTGRKNTNMAKAAMCGSMETGFLTVLLFCKAVQSSPYVGISPPT